MEELHLKESLNHLVRCRLRYEQAQGGDRTDAEHGLRQAIRRVEIETGNLKDRVERDVDLRGVYNQSLCEVEMSKGIIEQHAPARR